jgi:TrmH RNA methyltransferase
MAKIDPKREVKFRPRKEQPRTSRPAERSSFREPEAKPDRKADKELKYYGLHACLAIWKKRPKDIIRVYLDETNVTVFKALLKWCAENKKAYHIVASDELQKVSESVHHEGVCILAKQLPILSADEFVASLDKPKICLLYLDGVQNPHNIGSILRSCAHFGVPYVLGEQGKLPALSPSACRIAKGGSELVRLVSLPTPLKTLQALKAKGFTFVSTSSHGGTSLFKSKFGPKTVIIMGSETSGVSETLFSLAPNKVQIPGTGDVESLNVSVATSLCIGEYARQHT